VEPPAFDLVGAVVGENIAYALLRDRSTGKILRLRPGDEAGGWRVGGIDARSIELDRDGRRNTLALPSPAASAPAAAAANPDDADDGDGPPRLARKEHDP
jgi:hypothetical protein